MANWVIEKFWRSDYSFTRKNNIEIFLAKFSMANPNSNRKMTQKFNQRRWTTIRTKIKYDKCKIGCLDTTKDRHKTFQITKRNIFFRLILIKRRIYSNTFRNSMRHPQNRHNTYITWATCCHILTHSTVVIVNYLSSEILLRFSPRYILYEYAADMFACMTSNKIQIVMVMTTATTTTNKL